MHRHASHTQRAIRQPRNEVLTVVGHHVCRLKLCLPAPKIVVGDIAQTAVRITGHHDSVCLGSVDWGRDTVEEIIHSVLGMRENDRCGGHPNIGAF